MTTIRSPYQRARALAGRQHGAISHRQAVDAGLSPRQVDGLLRRTEWERAVRGVFVVAGSSDTPLRRLWVAYLSVAPARGLVSHQSAAALHGLLPHSSLPHVTVPYGRSSRSQGAMVHRARGAVRETQLRHGLRVATVSRTLTDLAACVDRSTLEELVDDAFCQRLATQGSTLAAAANAGPRKGTTLLRGVLDVWTPEIQPGSVAEVRLLRKLTELGYGNVVTQHSVFAPNGEFIARLDVAVPDLRAGLEYDGRRRHGPRQWARDEPRYAQIAAAGWTVDSIDKLDLLPGEARLATIVAAWSERRAAERHPVTL